MRWFSRHFSSKSRSTEKSAKTAPFAAPAEVIAPVAPAPQAAPAVEASASGSVSWMQRQEVNAAFLDWLFEDGDQSRLFASPAEQKLLTEVEQAILSKQVAADMVRRMPGVIPQLLQSLRTDDFSGAELARKISHDVVLVAEVIRIANSSLYKTTEEITSIERAVLVLGHSGLRQLITSVAFKPIIDLKTGYFTKAIAPKIWHHSEICARASRMLAESETVMAFEAFLAGLIQNVGFIVSLRFVDQLGGDRGVGSAGFCNALAALGRRLSVDIAREWRFPEAVANAIHEQDIFAKDTKQSPIGTVLALADYISKIQVLSGCGRMNAADPKLLEGLPEKARQDLVELIK
jgi:HD-like signal output (HDOD) protein